MNQRDGFFQVDTDLVARMEADARRPYDWQDKAVITASLIAIVCLAVILAI